MGWLAWDAYDQEAKKRWRALPWRERYRWPRIIIFALIVAFVAAIIWAATINRGHAQTVTVVKYGRPVVVVMAVEEYERLKRLDAIGPPPTGPAQKREAQG